MENSEKTKRLAIKVVIAAVVLGTAIAIYVLLTPPFHRFMGPLPFIVDEKVRKTLETYLTTQPSRRAYFVTGPHGCGKTKLISSIAEHFLKGGNMTIELDFSLATSAEEVIGFGKLSLIKSMNAYIRSEAFKELQKEMNHDDVLITAASVSDLFNSLISSLNSSLESSEGINDFFRALEAVSSLYKPAVFVYGGEIVAQYAPSFYAAFVSRLNAKDQYNDHIPVIFETADTLIKNENLPLIFGIIELGGIDDPIKRFVNDKSCFTKNEMKKVISSVGNNGGEIEAIFESLKFGYDVNTAIEGRFKGTNNTISALKRNGKSELLRHVCSSSKHFYDSVKNNDPILPLVKRGYIYINSENVLEPSTKLVSKLIC